MKNKFTLYSALMMLTLGSFLISSCGDDEDTTPPVVTLNGDAAPVLFLQATFVDPGATAVDDEDGTIPVTVDGTVDKNQTGPYVLTYSATDNSGNTGTATRTVIYQNEMASDPFEGSYSCIITTLGQPPYSYTESLSVSNTLNNALEWSKFGDYGNANAKLNILFAGSNQINIPQQTIICGNPAAARTFTGSGTRSGSGGTGSMIVLNIDETVNSQTASFTYTYTKQ